MPFAAVEQLAQSVRETAAVSFVARIRSEADLGPWSAGKLSFQVNCD